MSYRNIALVGGGGSLGTPVYDALVKSGKFDVTIISRSYSSYTPSDPSAKVAKVDYTNKEQLVDVLKGNEAVLITLGLPGLELCSKAIIDAAIEAGVKRVIPSEYGGDTVTGLGRETVALTPKHKVYDYLVEKSASGAIEFTALHTGPFFDWGLVTDEFLGFDIPNKKVTLYNGGTNPFNATTLESIGAAVVSVLSTPEKFKNKNLKISDFYTSQKEILSIIEAETGSKFEVQEVEVDKVQADCEAALRNGDWAHSNVFSVLSAAVFATRSSTRWGAVDDTPSLGLPKKDLKAETKKVLASL